MISAAVNSLSPDFSGLTAEISKSVSQIKIKAASQQPDFSGVSQTENFSDFRFNGLAVSYLEPQALFAVQKFVSETSADEKLNRQSEQKNVFKQAESNTAEVEQAKTSETFVEELASATNFSALRQGLFAYANDISQKSNLFLISGVQTVSGSYAADAYNYVAKINSKSPILIDFMHEFNRSFDYTI